MKWKSRQAAIASARQITPKYRVPFPDLSTEPSPCTNLFGPTPAKVQPFHIPDGFIVATTHKQGPAVHSIKELHWVGGRKI